ncbi:MAG: DNA replication and repair protein RecF [Gemmatimonadota bacterium]|jgi:DNA replication and repair protein RecF|nr:hypothetical protein [Gemmatimonadota bacterium]MDP6529470.1 DNA replication and repair protein RecF [Gemmatimonadota bacterium]MDP7030727.1 DNA replication and repair protein RecF [Gemmatimonadota bacterium]
MRLAHLSLTDFRGYESLELALTPGHHVFVGPNGHGKTNILEAAHLLGSGQSMRASRDTVMVRHGASGFRVGARLVSSSSDTSVRIEIEYREGRRKRILIDKEPARGSDLVAAVKVVSFAPADVELVQQGARVRRRYLDIIGCQVSAEYMQLLRDYQRAIRQRNETLSRLFVQSRGRTEAARHREPWDEQVVELGTRLFLRRADLVGRVSGTLGPLSRGSFPDAGSLGVSYRPAICWEGESPAEAFRQALRETREKDLALGYTTKGPQGDDIHLTLGGRDLRRFGSLGQQQLGAMFLKLCQAELVRESAGQQPILLVDEMFAVLDHRAAEGFLSRVEMEGQILMATAREGWLAELEDRKFFVHRVLDGAVLEKEAEAESES